jgi:hypothetical protein
VATLNPEVIAFFANADAVGLQQDRALTEGATFSRNTISSTLSYTAQPTDDGKHIYVEVSGQEPITRILSAANLLHAFATTIPEKPHASMDYKALKQPWMNVCPTYVGRHNPDPRRTEIAQNVEVCECVYRNALDQYAMETLVSNPNDKDILHQFPTDPKTGGSIANFRRDVEGCAGVLRYLPTQSPMDAVTASSNADDWTFTDDPNGVLMKSDVAIVLLRKSREAESAQYGKGKWAWANGGWRVTFPTKTLGFPQRDPPMDDGNHCRMQ